MASSPSPDAPNLDDPSERQAALRRYHVLDTAPEEEFDRITSLAAKVCDVPTALITLIDDERQWFKSCFGFDTRETDIGVSFCVHTVDAGDMMVVEDATTDPRFKDNPFVTEPPHVRFYAGAPLTTPAGVDIGTLCILDYEPRTFDASDREILTSLADTVIDQFERRSAEAQVRQLVEDNPQPMYVYATDGGAILNANAAARAQYGYDEATFLSLTVDDLEAPLTIQPAVKSRMMHERADGSRFAIRLREQDVLFDGRAARVAVPQLLSDDADDVPEIAFQAQPDGTLQSLSANWEAATGLSVSEAVGTRLTDLIVPADRPAALEVLSPLSEGTEESCRHETHLQTAEGERPFSVRARVIRNADETPVGVVGTLTPLGPAQSLPMDPEPDFSIPDRMDLSPETDYSMFSTSIPSFDPPSSEPSDASEEASSSIENAPASAPSDAVDLTSQLHHLLDRRAANHDRPDITLQRSLPDVVVPISFDPDEVAGLVDALLDNALTNTEEGSITLRLTTSAETAEIEIEDTGTSAEDRFMEVYTPTSSSAPTLHSIHQKANQMGLSLNMEDGESGTRFRLTVPRASDASSEKEPQ